MKSSDWYLLLMIQAYRKNISLLNHIIISNVHRIICKKRRKLRRLLKNSVDSKNTAYLPMISISNDVIKIFFSKKGNQLVVSLFFTTAKVPVSKEH